MPVSDLLFPSIFLLTGAVCLLRGLRTPGSRGAWIAIGVGQLLQSPGWFIYILILEDMAAPPFPSVSDGFWLGGYVLMYIGFVLLVRSRVAGLRAAPWLDGAIGALTVGAVAAGFAFDAVLGSTTGSPAAVATALAYPVADFVFLSLVVAVFVVMGWRPSGMWRLLALAIVVQIVTDAIYLNRIANETWHPGTLLDAGWGISTLLFAFAAWLPEEKRDVATASPRAMDAIATAFTVTALGVIAFDHFQPVSEVAKILAELALVAGAIRAVRAHGRSRSLASQQAGLEQNAAILEAAGEPIYMVNREGIVTYANPAAERALGWSREELVGVDADEHMRDGDAPAAADGRSDGTRDAFFRRKDGSTFPVEYTTTPLREGDSVVGHTVVFRDVSSRRRVEQRARARYAAAAALTEAVSVQEALDRVTVAVCEALGLQLGLTVRLDADENVMRVATCWSPDPETMDAVRELGIDRMSFGPDQGFIGIVWKEGTPTWVEDVRPLFVRPEAGDRLNIRGGFGIPIMSDHGCLGIFEFLSRDVVPRDEETLAMLASIAGQVGQFIERRRAEHELVIARDEALEASRLKSKFLANMSHEIRTPMNGVIGMTRLLLESGLPEPQNGYADAVRSSANALLTIIDDILDFSKIESGKLVLHNTPFRVGSAIEEVCELLAPRAHEKGLELAVLVRDEVPHTVIGDEVRLRQIVMNLLGNAIKFTEHGGVYVSLDALRRDHRGVVLRLEVKDTGIGIDAADAPALFDSFSQADSSTTRRFGGTGLGLAISRQLVEMMGGSIDLKSTAGEGSTFSVELRLPVADGAVETPGAEFAGTRALVVDHSATSRDVLVYQLRSWRMHVDAAGDASQALELLLSAARAGRPYDVVALDNHIPGAGGIELARQVRRERELNRQKVILLTSAGGAHAEAADAGIAACLMKPVRTSRLYDCITDVLAGSHRAPAAPAHPPVASEAPAFGAAGGSRVLVVEDNRINQTVAVHTLMGRGFDVDVAENGRQAVAKVAAGGFDAVLMDCHMPEMDGYEATREIRAAERPGTRLPIIAMTANTMAGDRERCLDAGMDDHLGKPLDPEALQAALARWVKAPVAEEPKANGNGGTPKPGMVARLCEQLGDAALADEVIQMFVDEAPARMDAIRAAADRGDADALKREAHTLKGSAATLGADRIRDLSGDLEARAAAGDLADAAHCAAALPGALERLVADLQAERAR